MNRPPSTTTQLISMFLLFFSSLTACGPGWDGYDENYSDVTPVNLAPWSGSETVFVKLDDLQVTVPLAGMQSYDYLGAKSIKISALVIASGLTQQPDQYRYDFTAIDGYDLYIKRYEDLTLLPSWTEMQQGYLYLDPRYNDLTCGWQEHPWGSALSAYQIKWMNGGTITLLGN